MTANDRDLILKLISNKISNDDFLNNFSVNVKDNNVMRNLLKETMIAKNADNVEYLLFIAFRFHLFTKEYVPILCDMILEAWHHSHEDIAMVFQSLKDSRSVECLYQTAKTQFEYLDFDEAYALAVKCIWALGDINTNEAKQKLELLTKSDNQIIRDVAIKQLNRIR